MSTFTSVSRRLLRPVSSHARKWVRHHNFEGEFQQTNITMLNHEEDTVLFINAFSPQGFRLNTGFRVFGPCVLFPKSVLHWNVKDANSINVESMSLITKLEPRIDIVVIGKGDKENQISTEVVKHLIAHKINMEILPTDQACGLFNFLNMERRYVAACMLPPTHLESSFGSGTVSYFEGLVDVPEMDGGESSEKRLIEEEAQELENIGLSEKASALRQTLNDKKKS